MAQPASGRTSEAALIRKEMAKSRETLESDLNELKSRVLGSSTQPKEATMAKKAKKKTRSATAKKRSNKQRPMTKRAKKVVGEMLTNAAIGAARGAAETVLEKTDGTKKVRGR